MTTASRRPGDALPSGQPAVLLFACCALFAACVATQYLAYRLMTHGVPRRWLGAWLYAADAAHATRWRWGAAAAAIVGATTALIVRRRWAPAIAVSSLAIAIIALGVSRGPVYAPTRSVSWMVQLRRVPNAAPAIESALYAFAGCLVMATVMAFAARPARPALVPSASHGSARWSPGDHFVRPNGVILGRPHAPTERPRGERSSAALLRYDGDGHLLTVAPTRSGKGTGCVIPNLLTYPGSVLVTDPKGENHAVTARHRVDMGQRVATLDPFAAVCGTDAFNPLDLIDPTSEDAIDDARLIADMLVVPDPRAREPHWDEEARGLLTGLTLHVAANAPPELRTLPHVRELLTLPPEPFALLLADMLESDAAGGLVRRSAARVLQKADRERSGVVSTAQSHTHFLDSPRMSRALDASTVDFAALKRGRLSVYLVLPPDRIEGYRRWLRLMIACALLATTRTPGQPAERALFLLDEFAHLGRMQPVERDIGLVGGYGVTFWLLVQDLAQLRGTYPDKWQSFLANADVLQAFGVNDFDTADHLSKTLGEATIHVASENRSAGRSQGHHAQRQVGAAFTTAERARRLLTPDEVLRLGADEQLLFARGRDPVRARRLDYRTEPALAGLADANPMYTSTRAASG